MSISNHAELVTAVGNYLHRSDLNSLIPDFIVLAEAKLNRKLRLRAMENVATGSVAASISLPTGFIEMKSLTTDVGGSTRALTYIPPNGINDTAGTAYTYSIVGDSLYFIPTGSGESYTLTYYKKFDALSSGVNWLITNAPDAYLYATLLEAMPYIKNDARMTTWFQMLQEVVNQLNAADKKDRYGSDLIVRPA